MGIDSYRTGYSAAAEMERAIYFDTLMKSNELGERLITNREPVAREYFYGVSDPTIIGLLDIPTELLYGDRAVAGVVFEITEIPQGKNTSASVTFVIEFDDESTARIPVPDAPMSHVPYDFVPPQPDPKNGVFHTDEELVKPLCGFIDPDVLSALISRTVVPHMDPAFTNYEVIHTPEERREIMELLESRDYTQIDKVRFYEIEGSKVTVSSTTERISEIAVTQLGLPGDPYEIALRTALDQHRHSQELFVSDSAGRKSVPPYPEEIKAFNDTLTFLLDQLRPQDESLEAEQDAELQRNSRKLPEERD